MGGTGMKARNVTILGPTPKQMGHQNAVFSQAAVQEWLIYFKRSYRTFAVDICGEGKEYPIGGRYSYSGNIDLSLQIDVPSGVLELDLRADKSSPWNRRLFGTAPLVGKVLLVGIEGGSCRVENSHHKGTPVIHLESLNPRCEIDAHRTDVDLTTCPLIVSGIDSCEMVLEDYEMLDRSRRQALPATKPRRNFVGSCRTLDSSPDPVGRALKEIGLLVAVTQLIVKDYFMRVVC